MSAAAAATVMGTVAADTAAGSSIVVQDSMTAMTHDVTIKDESEIPTTATPMTPLLEETTGITTLADAAVDTNHISRVVRLEQNRKAASESRKRKRILLDELQRSVIFFTRANDTLKQQNQNLQTLLQQAQSQIKNMDKKNDESNSEEAKATTATATPSEHSTQDSSNSQNNEDTVKVHLPIVIPPAQAPLQISNFLNTVETGATIQAMTNFQQAASAAMKAALLHMQQQYNNNNNGDAVHGSNGLQQQHHSLFEIATLTVPTSNTKSTTGSTPTVAVAAAKSSSAMNASNSENTTEL